MAASDIVARVVALIGGAAILMRRQAPGSETPAVGAAPAIPEARPQAIPTLKMPTARGWSGGRTPVAAPGLKVNAFATGLKHPRWIEVLPNGDVLAAEALMTPGGIRTAFDYAIHATMKRAAAVGASPNRITRLRDADGDGVAEERGTFLDGLNQPFGMALVGDTFYVGNTDGVVAFPYEAGAPRITAPGRPVAALRARRPLDPQPHPEPRRPPPLRRRRLAHQHRRPRPRGRGGPRRDLGDRPRHRRRPRLRLRPAQPGRPRLGAPTGALWTVVNERDGLGDETPPDYLTSVRDGGFYGWPFCYWGQTVDDPRAPGPGDGRHAPSGPTTPSAATPPRSASAGCRPAPCPASPTAW